jgi:hypothetical protein
MTRRLILAVDSRPQRTLSIVLPIANNFLIG